MAEFYFILSGKSSYEVFYFKVVNQGTTVVAKVIYSKHLTLLSIVKKYFQTWNDLKNKQPYLKIFMQKLHDYFNVRRNNFNHIFVHIHIIKQKGSI